MTRTEHLLTILAEECAEVAQRVSKALRLGPHDVQPGQSQTNAERVRDEMLDLVAVYSMLVAAKVLPPITDGGLAAAWGEALKVERLIAYSAAQGTVDGEKADPSCPHPEAGAQ